MKSRNHHTFRIPAMIALASLVGLISALIGDGIFDAVSWTAFVAVLGVILWALFFRAPHA